MDQKSPALSALRAATRALHEQLEASLPIAAPAAGRDDYLCYLQDMWGWMAAFEDRLWRAAWPPEMQAAQRAGKLAWIEADLRAGGMRQQDIEGLPRAAYSPRLDSMPACFGLAYVVEGAQLGTRVLGRRLGAVLGEWTPRWLQGYGERNAEFWRDFLQCSERVLNTPEARAEAAQAAADAFASLAAWFAQGQRRRKTNSGWHAA